MITVKPLPDHFGFPPPREIKGQTLAAGDVVSFTMPRWRPGGATFHGEVTRVAPDHDAIGVKVMTEGGRWIVFLVPSRALRKIAKREDAA